MKQVQTDPSMQNVPGETDSEDSRQVQEQGPVPTPMEPENDPKIDPDSMDEPLTNK